MEAACRCQHQDHHVPQETNCQALSRCLGLNVSTCAAGDIRNDLYLTLERGDFERGGKSVQKNIEITVYVLYADGEILKVWTISINREDTLNVTEMPFCLCW